MTEEEREEIIQDTAAKLLFRESIEDHLRGFAIGAILTAILFFIF